MMKPERVLKVMYAYSGILLVAGLILLYLAITMPRGIGIFYLILSLFLLGIGYLLLSKTRTASKRISKRSKGPLFALLLLPLIAGSTIASAQIINEPWNPTQMEAFCEGSRNRLLVIEILLLLIASFGILFAVFAMLAGNITALEFFRGISGLLLASIVILVLVVPATWGLHNGIVVSPTGDCEPSLQALVTRGPFLIQLMYKLFYGLFGI